jgi:NAD+ synthase
MIDIKIKLERTSDWLKRYMETTGFKGFVIGLSGGIDSAVSLGVAIKAVGKENIRCFALPCTSEFEKVRKEDQDDAQLVADAFGVKLEKIFLDEEASEIFIDVLPYNTNNSKLVLPNIKARLRMVTLRALAEGIGYLVLGTTNKTEEYLGYYTKAGDGGAGVDVEPIADYFKYEIRELAKELGVPEKIITKSPSAGLWDNQTDEDEIGFKYDDIDKYLSIREDFTRYNNSSAYKKIILKINDKMDIKWQNIGFHMKESHKVKAARVDEKLIDRVERMIVAGNHKRNNPPYFRDKKLKIESKNHFELYGNNK